MPNIITTGPKSSPYSQDKREVYITNYGDRHTGITITSHAFTDKVCFSSSPIAVSKTPVPMSDEEKAYERIKKASRRIKDVLLANAFDVMAVITWRAKYKRCSPEIQNIELREFFGKLRKKYPDITVYAVRHKNPLSDGYHVHVLIGNLPRRALRIKKGKYDEEDRQTYCLLGWSRKGWASAEYIVNREGVAHYFANPKKIALLPQGVHSIVFRSRNLIKTERESCGMSDEEIEALLADNKKIEYESSFFAGRRQTEKLYYIMAEGRINISQKRGGDKP